MADYLAINQKMFEAATDTRQLLQELTSCLQQLKQGFVTDDAQWQLRKLADSLEQTQQRYDNIFAEASEASTSTEKITQ